jgi:hypothetical protein
MHLGTNVPHGSNINKAAARRRRKKSGKILNFVADMVQDGKRRKSKRDK